MRRQSDLGLGSLLHSPESDLGLNCGFSTRWVIPHGHSQRGTSMSCSSWPCPYVYLKNLDKIEYFEILTLETRRENWRWCWSKLFGGGSFSLWSQQRNKYHRFLHDQIGRLLAFRLSSGHFDTDCHCPHSMKFWTRFPKNCLGNLRLHPEQRSLLIELHICTDCRRRQMAEQWF
jgi:hypothetical protein